MSAFGRDLNGMYHAVLSLDPDSHATIAPVLHALSAPNRKGKPGNVTNTVPTNDAWMPWSRSAPPTSPSDHTFV